MQACLGIRRQEACSHEIAVLGAAKMSWTAKEYRSHLLCFKLASRGKELKDFCQLTPESQFSSKHSL